MGAGVGYLSSNKEDPRNIKLRKTLVGGLTGGVLGGFTGSVSTPTKVDVEDALRKGVVLGGNNVQSAAEEMRRDPDSLLRAIHKLDPQARTHVADEAAQYRTSAWQRIKDRLGLKD